MAEAKTHGTNVHIIDGVTYVEVARKAKVGEKVIIVNAKFTNGMYDNGSVLEAEQVVRYGIRNNAVIYDEGDGGCNSAGYISDEEYRVLEPVAAEPTEPRNERDMLASLAHRITRIEKRYDNEINTLYRNVQALAEELEALKHAKTERTAAHMLGELIAKIDAAKGGGGR